MVSATVVLRAALLVSALAVVRDGLQVDVWAVGWAVVMDGWMVGELEKLMVG